jgi:D-aminoacyl-tRNA deacylase
VRALLQRVTRAEVHVDGECIGRIGLGLVVFLGVGREDTEDVADGLARKIAGLRIFRDPAGRTNLDISEVGGNVLVVSQFTLYADTRRGRRPGFGLAADADHADRLYRRFSETVRGLGSTVETGRFGAEMAVDLTNDGPFTIWLDTASGTP